MRHEHSHSRPDCEGGGAGFLSLDRFSLHALWHAIGRGHHGHYGPRGGGPFGGADFGFGSGDGRMPRGRKFTSDDLQLLLLALLAEEPRHGYELIKALEVRSNGFYTPSAGMVYPALTHMEELDYVTVEAQGNRKRYALAAVGQAYLAANRERVDLMFAKLGHFARKMDSVRRAFAGEGGSDDVSDNPGGWLPQFTQARRALKHALLLRDNASVDEQRRLAGILARATAEIELVAAPAREGNGDE
ncbi:PadR family transcriptional regulator [Paralcaligenes ginsengisoli]